ncbi:hypothetical protein [Microbacterium album]|uniref:Lipoprotein LpqN n=1 Tax=Microbacterium album TaxID=2053191 RepID=A0A917IFX2_9MICO|nr:hypothetical protein [Microbacterium album]GGH39803.1 hypothetical protein GCM10010921_11300 [Microbacterium album]
MRACARGIAAGLLLAAALVTSACGPAPWTWDGQPPQDTPTPTTTPVVVPRPVPNDLSGGSTQREVQAGAVTVTVDYWSTLSMDQWTATALKPVSLSLTATVTPDDGQRVYLQSAAMIAAPGAEDGGLAPLAEQRDQARVQPGYLVLDPYSYSNTFNIGEVPAEATFVTAQFTFDFLVQTTPTSEEFAKQSATDTLTIAITQPPSDG